ncbi:MULTISPECIES: S8 family peptidase [Micromonospora]|uniref:S8 family peptidase n=1 Tax=Micromonospora aurantiaca (nom. illeg.) TaxID=47850 RepID=A0A1C6SVT3_9ACTN|nr:MULTISPECIES: S8 family peptidase [Micromonospora]ADL45137.1 peptidase S8 and S53 subtilisin kexin sedolisin [Micromonospora aurantiaca ATCC 27029]ADU07368.1 peptidase S8 and S53 subtilisin kexin sedolisin [Micromonospora sp. L5]AXH91267.1 S8 family peptidase [Micromonospora aurantiaca]KAB1108893.1 S8 family peptidase [Micromonospora aurantiaca]MBC9003934.1 S8 family peptidase [Micromonospora aurantiaca]
MPDVSLPRRRALRALAVTAAAAAFAAAASTPALAAPTGEIRYAGAADAVSGSYVVVLKGDAVGTANTLAARTAVPDRAAGLAKRYGGNVGTVWSSALTGYSAKMTPAQARRLAADPAVAYVEQDRVMTTQGTQTGATWGLDRIDQRNLPLNSTFTYPNTASNVRAYIIDTGIRTTHSDFGGRATWGTNTVDTNNTDCNGHGTHVAGTVGGTRYGVAKSVRLVAVKVLNCSGSGTTAGVISGVNWVTSNAVKPAVANMSLGGGASTTLDNAVANSINSGITYALAAGNSSANACNSSPARVASAITVGSTTSTDARSSFSNYGSCVDIFAPGSSITSAWRTSDTATNTISGTSMASPHVAGAAALVLSANTSYTPAQVASYLTSNATTGKVTSPGSGSPNRLLFVVN